MNYFLLYKKNTFFVVVFPRFTICFKCLHKAEFIYILETETIMAKMSVPSVFCGEGLYHILPGIFSTLYNEQGRENISGTNNRLNNTGPGTGTGA